MKEERVLTLHPQGKKGVNILKRRYTIIRKFILDTLEKEKTITYQSLSDRAVEELSDNFDGKVVWYIVSVKLDLEARKIVERIPKTSPHQIRIYKS